MFVQWTGTDVVPPSIAIRDAKAATKAFGRKTLLWDNYPVNDFEEPSGRLLMAPYDRREPGLADELSGILANPMNQEPAMGHWGKALQASTSGLIADLSDDPASAVYFREAAAEAEVASALSTVPGTTRPQGKIGMGGGVLDRFIRSAPHLVAERTITRPTTAPSRKLETIKK